LFSSLCRIRRSLNAEAEGMAAEADSTAVAAVDSTGAGASVAADIPVSAVAGDHMAAGRIEAEADSRRAPMAGLHIEVLDLAADRLRV
jgi:limonene-1,2-epoxide hydrolase